MKRILSAILLFTLTHTVFAQLQLNGAGATFPYVLYSKWFDEYQKKTGIQFNYQSIGSGGGIKQVIEGTVDFGATDGPMSDVQLEEAKKKQGTDILHIPTVLGAVVATYNVSGIGPGLKLTPDVLAEIFLGTVTMWNDAKIAAVNKGVALPNKPIVVVHRSDGSGTTYIFVDYLSKVSADWKRSVGVGTSVKWPLGLGGKGNEGVAGQVKQIDGSIGYVELAYAVKNNLSYASIRNQAGNFITPSLESVTAAAMSEAKKMPSDLRVSITNAAGKDSYPISGFTWLLIYQQQKDEEKAKAMIGFLKWAFREGKEFAPALYYAPLPKEVIVLNEKKIASIRYRGTPVR
jgi:phosphate transport system substrate-binding protein